MVGAGRATIKSLLLAAAICFYVGLAVGGQCDPISAIVFVCATISSITGFAFSAVSGAMLLHIVRDPVEAVQIMLVASIALQTYRVWALRKIIQPRELLPHFFGGPIDSRARCLSSAQHAHDHLPARAERVSHDLRDLQP
jgi:hypothetical protein